MADVLTFDISAEITVTSHDHARRVKAEIARIVHDALNNATDEQSLNQIDRVVSATVKVSAR